MSESFKEAGRGPSFAGIGPLEARILATVWEEDPQPVRVREVYEQLRTERQIAYTTVMTVMGNLVKKGLLLCDRSQAAYLYRAALPAKQVGGEVLASVVRTFFGGQPGAVVASLLGLDEGLSEEQLRELREQARQLVGG